MERTTITRPARRPRLDGHATCVCGQELDCCRRAHCPRCGHRLPVDERCRVAALTSAA